MRVVYYRIFKQRALETFRVHQDREIFTLKNDQPV